MSPNKQSAETPGLRGALLALLGEGGGSPKGLYANTCGLGSKREELEACMQLQGCRLPGISCGGTASTTGALPRLDAGSSGRSGQDGEEGRAHGSGLEGRPTWVTLPRVSATRPPDHKGADEAFFRELEEASHSQAVFPRGP